MDSKTETTTEHPDELLESYFEKGLSPAEAIDYLAVEKCGRSQTEWAKVRGRQQPTVAENVSKAKQRIERGEWCGRSECPACQGYSHPPDGVGSDCPYLGIDLLTPEDKVEIRKERGIDSLLDHGICENCGSEDMREETKDGHRGEYDSLICNECGIGYSV